MPTHHTPIRASLAALALLAGLAAGASRGVAQGTHQHAHPADTAFDSLQQRGERAMGVNQYTSTHRFDDLPDGGRIELTRDAVDTAGVRAIREHLAGIARAFAAGDFATPHFVHARDVPGTATMAAKRDVIRYRFRPLPGGGEVRISTTDPDAVRAVHAFLAFQRSDHHAGGMTHGH